MEVARATLSSPNPGRRSTKEADADEEVFETDAPEPAADLYALLGYRPSFMSRVTTQQLLAVRLIEL